MSAASSGAGPSIASIRSAAAALKAHAEEVNRLNVFPVPDGDTGTNMSLTMDAVVAAVDALGSSASLAEVCHAVSHGSLMGARGNSGVILSQILRGLCEGVDAARTVDADLLAASLERAVSVAFQAVRKPVEGTMLTVIKDAAAAAAAAKEAGLDLDAALEAVTAESFASVKRTPDLLPVLKENGVVDAGGYGLALLIEGFTAATLDRAIAEGVISSVEAPLHIELAEDWDDEEYLYCTEFLLFGETIDRDTLADYISGAGGSELVVGGAGEFKIHVHTNDPAAVLAHVTGIGEVAEVHVNNMRRQQKARDAELSALAGNETVKPLGFVAVAAGSGLADILRSLGADEIVSGGQTMNPSTADLLAAIERVPAETVIVLPNNKNIHLAANAAASVAKRQAVVVPTRSVPAAFAALLAVGAEMPVDDLVAQMTEAAEAVRTGEITTAVKHAKWKSGTIEAGQVIGIVDDDAIEAVGTDIAQVAVEVALLLGDDAETITLLAGADLTDEALAELSDRVAAALPDVEIETLRGEQPLYPVMIAAE